MIPAGRFRMGDLNKGFSMYAKPVHDVRSEWEYVARSGTRTAYSWGNRASRAHANYGRDDCWHGDYRGSPTDGSAWSSGRDCGVRVSRGGSWIDVPWYLRAANRDWYSADDRNVSVGFRVARTLSR